MAKIPRPPAGYFDLVPERRALEFTRADVEAWMAVFPSRAMGRAWLNTKVQRELRRLPPDPVPGEEYSDG